MMIEDGIVMKSKNNLETGYKIQALVLEGRDCRAMSFEKLSLV